MNTGTFVFVDGFVFLFALAYVLLDFVPFFLWLSVSCGVACFSDMLLLIKKGSSLGEQTDMTCFSFFCGRWINSSQDPQHSRGDDEELGSIQNVRCYTYKELRNATEGFSTANKIGEGGFGSVYKGRLKHGKIAAIKVLSAESRQGVNEFLAEIKAMSEIEHENLVKLYGCCVEDNHRILVYNYLENNSLAQTLLGYLAPEYAIQGKLNRKADLYSFGVLLLEIVSGRNNTNTRLPVEEQYLLERTWELFERRELVALVDESLNGDFDADEACRVLKIGLLCTQDDPNRRPSMSTVVKMLTGLKNVDDSKITRPGLISDFLDVKVRAPCKTTASATTSSNVSLMTNDTSLSTSEKSSGVTTTGFHGSI
ncbi:hypothetical protein SADUNF_Sadunf16G0289000 [Salix dunnii]|uniref:Protein kinase domain-containing protein n=1 Tax=Salix dunnii TaxID=1413687 RepID=A0A835JCU1_9ROSI|nr:hypothetical protein SADUNF_Sadunf16G0289000 [Salix dunnii]